MKNAQMLGLQEYAEAREYFAIRMSNKSAGINDYNASDPEKMTQYFIIGLQRDDDFGNLCFSTCRLLLILGEDERVFNYMLEAFKTEKNSYKHLNNPKVAVACYQFTVKLKELHRYKEAIELLEEAIERKMNNNEPSIDIAQNLEELGILYQFDGNPQKSIERLEKSIKIKKFIYQGEPWRLTSDYMVLRESYQKCGEHKKAVDLYYSTKEISIANPHNNSIFGPYICGYLQCMAIDIARYYSFEPFRIINKFQSYGQDNNFASYELHFSLALSLHNTNTMEALDEYLLALIFIPHEQTETIFQIKRQLNELGITNTEIDIWLAVTNGYIDDIKDLISLEVNCDYVSFMELTPLMQAILNSHDDIISILVHNGVNINAATDTKDTAMHIAHKKANIDIIKLLIKHGGDINAKNVLHKTPLHCLLENNAIATKEKLQVIQEFQSKYDFTILDKQGSSTIDYAAEYCIDAIKFMVKLGDSHLELSGDTSNVTDQGLPQ
jgi:tetratricopeptide (TPR) repeat protein